MLPSLPGSRIIRRRDPRLALYPFALDDASAGVFRDLMTNVDATLSGGSTLLAQEKFRNDYQRLTSTFPSLGYRASGAGTNGYYAIDPDSPSYSAGTVGGWLTLNGAVLAYTADEFWQTPGCMRVTCGANSSGGSQHDVTAATAVATRYIKQVMIKAPAGKAMRLTAYDDVGSTNTDWTASGGWEFKTVTRTWDAASTARSYRVGFNASGASGDIFYQDYNLFTTGSTPLVFTEKEVVATTATVPTPFTAGEPVSFLCFVWTPWVGNDGIAHYLFSIGTPGANNTMWCSKYPTNSLYIYLGDNAGLRAGANIDVNGVNWPAGFHAVAASFDADANCKLAIDGVLSASIIKEAGVVRESALDASTYIGSNGGGALQFNGIILPYFYRGVAWGDAECEYYSTLQAPPPRTRMVA